MSQLMWVGLEITCVKLKQKIRSHDIADVVVEAHRVDPSILVALKSPSRMTHSLSEERTSVD